MISALSVWIESSKIVHIIRQAWGLVPRPQRCKLGGTLLIMTVTSAGNTLVALLLGTLIDRIQSGVEHGQTAKQLYIVAAEILGALCLIYLVRKLLHIYRRYLVEDSCTSINRDGQTKLVEHLLKAPLTLLSKEKVGTLHGKIFRSVDGLVHFHSSLGTGMHPRSADRRDCTGRGNDQATAARPGDAWSDSDVVAFDTTTTGITTGSPS